MSKDINPVLNGWDYEPDELQVRIVAGDDGREKLQMRIDLGLVQMELIGRPDGTRPLDFDSLLDAYEAKAKSALAKGEEFSLDQNVCTELAREGYQFYHRYLAAFHLQRYDLVARDTERNLRLFAFVVSYAKRPRDKVQLDRYRPYVVMMRTRALTHIALGKNEYANAIALIDEGVEAIRGFLKDYEELDNEAECAELGFLLRWRREVERERPLGPVERLEEQLELAVALEDYEEAGRIRDQLRRLKGATLGASD